VILRRSCRFLILRWGLSRLGGPGALRDTIAKLFGRLGVPLDLDWRVLGWPLASMLGVRGDPCVPLARRRFQRPPPRISVALCGAISEPNSCPEGFQNRTKIRKKRFQNGSKNWLDFLIGFGSVFF